MADLELRQALLLVTDRYDVMAGLVPRGDRKSVGQMKPVCGKIGMPRRPQQRQQQHLPQRRPLGTASVLWRVAINPVALLVDLLMLWLVWTVLKKPKI